MGLLYNKYGVRIAPPGLDSWTPYYVTNLNDDGPGSFRRYAEDTSGPRIIRFAVGGTINLVSPVQITNGSCFIDGAWAPGVGVQIMDSAVYIRNCSDVYVRHMRFRCGINGSTPEDDYGLLIYGDASLCSQIFVWNCSVYHGAGTGETFAISGDVRTCYVLDTIMARGCADDESHSSGLFVDTGANTGLRLLVRGCLLAQSLTRNPILKGGGEITFRDNVVADVGTTMVEVQQLQATGFYRIWDNLFIPGPSGVYPIGPVVNQRRPIKIIACNAGGIDVRGNLLLNSSKYPNLQTQLELCGEGTDPYDTADVASASYLANPDAGASTVHPDRAREIIMEAGARMPLEDEYDWQMKYDLLNGVAVSNFNWDDPTASVPAVTMDKLVQTTDRSYRYNPADVDAPA